MFEPVTRKTPRIASLLLSVGGHHAFDRAVALGLVARHGVAGDAIEARMEARRWNPHFRQAVVDHAMSVVGHIREGLLALEADPRPSDPEWRDALWVVCRDRDDLESIQAVLKNPPASLVAARTAIDEAACELANLLPETPVLEDEWLGRAADADPQDWWGSFTPIPGSYPQDRTARPY